MYSKINRISYSNCDSKIIIGTPHHTTAVLQPFFGNNRVSWCQKRTSGLYGARED